MVIVIINFIVFLSSIIIRLPCNCLFLYLSFLLHCEQLMGTGLISAQLCILSSQHRESLKHLLNEGVNVSLPLNTALAAQMLAATRAVLEVYSREESGKGGPL